MTAMQVTPADRDRDAMKHVCTLIREVVNRACARGDVDALSYVRDVASEMHRYAKLSYTAHAEAASFEREHIRHHRHAAGVALRNACRIAAERGVFR